MQPTETFEVTHVAEPGLYTAPAGPLAEPPLAGTIRVRRSGALAGAIVFAILALATAGVMSGLNKAAAVSHRLGPQGLSVQVTPGKTVLPATAVPIGALTGPEPGSPAIGTPVGPAATTGLRPAAVIRGVDASPAARQTTRMIGNPRQDTDAADGDHAFPVDQAARRAPQRPIDDSDDPDQAAADQARARRMQERYRDLRDQRDRYPPADPRDADPDPR